MFMIDYKQLSSQIIGCKKSMALVWCDLFWCYKAILDIKISKDDEFSTNVWNSIPLTLPHAWDRLIRCIRNSNGCAPACPSLISFPHILLIYSLKSLLKFMSVLQFLKIVLHFLCFICLFCLSDWFHWFSDCSIYKFHIDWFGWTWTLLHCTAEPEMLLKSNFDFHFLIYLSAMVYSYILIVRCIYQLPLILIFTFCHIYLRRSAMV